MTTLTGGEVLLRRLAQEGVRRIIGITDEGYHVYMDNKQPCPQNTIPLH